MRSTKASSRNPPKKAFFARITGRVQGVAFRYYTKNEADRLGVKGWVRNTDDGSVEVWAEGDSDTLAAFLEYLNVGPSHARVDSCATNWEEPSGCRSFRVVYYSDFI
jgi:acylphosphatase